MHRDLLQIELIPFDQLVMRHETLSELSDLMLAVCASNQQVSETIDLIKNFIEYFDEFR